MLILDLFWLQQTIQKSKESGGLHFWKVFYHWEIMGWTSGFLKIMETASADAFEMTCRWLTENRYMYGGYLMIIMDNCPYFSIETYVVGIH